jgi:Putative zinc-finger
VRTHLSNTEIETYRSRTASPEQLLAVSDHILECAECQRRLESPARLRASYDEIGEDLKATLFYSPEHLDYGQLAGYVDGTLDAKSRESVSAHTDHCVECTSELREIAALKSLIEKEADSQPRRAKRDRLATLLRTPRYRLSFVLSVIVVMFAFMSWFQLRRMHLRIVELEGATARLEQENNYLRRQTEEIKTKASAGTSLTLKDGNRKITLNEKGELLGLDGLPANYRDTLKDALTTGRVSTPLPRRLPLERRALCSLSILEKNPLRWFPQRAQQSRIRVLYSSGSSLQARQTTRS